MLWFSAYCDEGGESQSVSKYMSPESYVTYKCVKWDGANPYNSDECSSVHGDSTYGAAFYNETEFLAAISLLTTAVIPHVDM